MRQLSDRFLEDVVAEVESIAAAMPVPPPLPARALASAITGSIDGIALQAVLRDESPVESFQALKAMILGFAAMSYLAAGEEPPLERLFELLAPAI